MHNKDGGTYDFEKRSDQRSELERLQKQARLDIEAEREMWKLAGLKPDMKVLDLACGPGVGNNHALEQTRDLRPI